MSPSAMGRKPECRDDHGWSRAALEGHGDGMDAGGRAMQEQLPDGRERPALPTDWRQSFLRLSGLAAWMHAPKNACFVCRDQHPGARAEKCILHFRRAGARVPRRPWMAERGWHCHQLATIAPSLFGISGVDARAEKCSCIFDGQEPSCLGGHGWPREAGIAHQLATIAPSLFGISGVDARAEKCSCIFGIAAIHGGKKNGSICSRQNKR